MQGHRVDVDGARCRNLERRVCESNILTNGDGSHEEGYGREEAQGLKLNG